MKTLMTIWIFSFGILLWGQTTLIEGIILDEEGFGMADVEICIKGKEVCTYTDIEGRYSIEAGLGEVLVIYSLDATNKEIRITDSEMNITLESLVEELVVSSYSDLEKPSADTSTVLSGRVPGVTISEEKSEAFVIRGATSIRSSKSKGAPGSAPGSTAIYGSRSPESVTVRHGSCTKGITNVESISSGQLTAGEVNDFSKWDYWEDIHDLNLMAFKIKWSLFAKERFSMMITQENVNPVGNQEVRLMDFKGNIVWESRTDMSGKAELWANAFLRRGDSSYFLEYKNEKGKWKKQKAIPISQGVNFGQVEICRTTEQIDIAFMMDATGSMGDEMQYLQSELYDVMRTLRDTLSSQSVRMASVFYRDHTDSYVTRYEDFQYSLVKSLQFMKAQNAGGGGDYPEAYLEALELSINTLTWREDSEVKLLFTILDAPPHHSETYVKRLHKILYRASQKGIKIIPIASSGINKETEYLLRSSALLTNGTYVFLTDDSGIGGKHLKPTIDTYEVEMLNALLKRLVMQYAYSNDCDEVEPSAMPHSTFLDSQIKQQEEGEVETTLIEVYPIPTKKWLHIKSEKKYKEVQLVDFSGKIMLRDISGKKTRFDIERFPKGVYYLRVFFDDTVYDRKVILK